MEEMLKLKTAITMHRAQKAMADGMEQDTLLDNFERICTILEVNPKDALLNPQLMAKVKRAQKNLRSC